jgi:hypothetical protein
LSLTQHDPNVFAKGVIASTAVAAHGDGTALKAQIDNSANAAQDALNPSLNPEVSGTVGVAHPAGFQVYNVPLMYAIFNIEKYFPLLLTDQGLDIYLTLNSTKEIGCYEAAVTGDYELSNVQYIAHEVHLDDGFVNQMKASMAATGGMLSLSSTTYRYYQLTGGTGDEDLNIS